MRKITFGLGALAAAAVWMANASPARADLIGSTVDVAAFYPDTSTLFQDGGLKVVGPGIEYPTGTFSAYNPNISVDLSAAQIDISLNGTSTFFLNASFNGFIITDLSGIFLSASIDAASGFSPVSIQISGNQLLLNYADLSASGDSIMSYGRKLVTA
jgi:hypothetical protein